MMKEVVIKIEEEIFEELTKYDKPIPSGNRLYDSVLLSVYNGISLPENHGDLKDVKKLKQAFVAWSRAVQGNFTDTDIASIIYNSPTIIEAAGKEVEE